MKKYTFNCLCLLAAVSLMLGSCQKDELVDNTSTTNRTLTLTAKMPGNETNLKVAPVQADGSLDIELLWEEGDQVQTFFRQNGQIVQGTSVSPVNIATNLRSADFSITVPDGIDTNSSFDLYAVYGVNAQISEDGTTVLLDASPSPIGGFERLSEVTVPLYLKLDGVNSDTGLTGTFGTFGALQVLTIKNTSNVAMTINDISGGVSLTHLGDYWYYLDQSSFSTYYYDLLSNTIMLMPMFPPPPFPPSEHIVAQGSNIKLAQWVVPNGTIPPAINLTGVINGVFQSTAIPMPARTEPLEVGHAYHLYALWDGTALSFSDEASTQSDGVITMTTSLDIGSSINLIISTDLANMHKIWIDLNNNGTKDAGEQVDTYGYSQSYTIQSKTIAVYGKVKGFVCSDNSLTSLNASDHPTLAYLTCRRNSLSSVEAPTTILTLDCSSNSISSLDVSAYTNLSRLICMDNDISSLDLASNPALEDLYCDDNNLSSIDLSANTALGKLYCKDNKITSLTINSDVLNTVWCSGNQISGAEMDNLVNSLPSSGGTLQVITNYEEGNVCTSAQVQVATAKGWSVVDAMGNPYPGS